MLPPSLTWLDLIHSEEKELGSPPETGAAVDRPFIGRDSLWPQLTTDFSLLNLEDLRASFAPSMFYSSGILSTMVVPGKGCVRGILLKCNLNISSK